MLLSDLFEVFSKQHFENDSSCSVPIAFMKICLIFFFCDLFSISSNSTSANYAGLVLLSVLFAFYVDVLRSSFRIFFGNPPG